jgi:hypothetical protein
MPYIKQTSSPNERVIHGKLRDCARFLLGKTIKAVVLKGGKKGPNSMMILVFTDGTSYEIYGDLVGASGLDRQGLEGPRRYLNEAMLDVFEEVDQRNDPGRRARFLAEVN